MKNLVLGMGNPILSDDGVGLIVARAMENSIEGVDVITTELVGLHVMDMLVGYDKVFLIDAATTGGKPVGFLQKLDGGTGSLHLFTSHGLNFPELLQLGKEMGYKMPEVAAIYGIEICDEAYFGEELSRELAEKLDSKIETIRDDITSVLANRDCDGSTSI
jgi:hydrogenase maturation protease